MVSFMDGRADHLLQLPCESAFEADGILPKSCRHQTTTSAEDRLLLPFEDILELAPGDTTGRDLQIDFRHQLRPMKLAIVVNEKTYPVKLAPEVGALLRPLPMTRAEFVTAQSRISGMHESSRRCASSLYQFMTRAANMSDVPMHHRCIDFPMHDISV